MPPLIIFCVHRLRPGSPKVRHGRIQLDSASRIQLDSAELDSARSWIQLSWIQVSWYLCRFSRLQLINTVNKNNRRLGFEYSKLTMKLFILSFSKTRKSYQPIFGDILDGNILFRL